MAILEDERIYLGTSVKPEYLTLKLANRHGLITGATGTGKTVSLQILAEGFSAAGVPVFCADVKGDLSGVAAKGEAKDFLLKRASQIGLGEEYVFSAFPVMFWDLFGEKGHPIRTTISEMGPLLLSRLMELNDTQEGVLNIAFRIADEEGLLLLDLKDLRALLVHVAERADEITAEYGNISKASVGAIQRRLLVIEEQGGEEFFGEPAFNIADLMRTERDGRGFINVLAADRLMNSPRLYATFLLWLLSELFEELPEIGDPEKPRLVFFFDEAHLLFDEAPRALLDKVEQVVRLIRSKGVGVYFVTQNPLDVPDAVLAQLGNRVQHALRAYSPREQKAVRTAAETFRPNPKLDITRVITELGVGEALVSTLEAKGIPSMVERTLIRPPSSRLGPLTAEERRAVLAQSPVRGIYDQAVDRESAHEVLKRRADEASAAAEKAEREAKTVAADERGGRRTSSGFQLPDFGQPRETSRPSPTAGTKRTRTRSSGSRRQSTTEALVKSAARSFGTTLGRVIMRGILGSLKKIR